MITPPNEIPEPHVGTVLALLLASYRISYIVSYGAEELND